MTGSPSQGRGECVCDAQMTFRVRKSPLLMGAGPDAISAVFRSVHRTNRALPDLGRVAIALPDLNDSRGFSAIGDVVRVFGTPDHLRMVEAALDDLRERKLLEVSEISPVTAAHGSVGTAFMRSRSGEKCSEAGLERARRRFETRHADDERTWRERKWPKGRFDRSGVFVRISEVRLQIVTREATFTGVVDVSTYGLCSSQAESGLPVELIG